MSSSAPNQSTTNSTVPVVVAQPVNTMKTSQPQPAPSMQPNRMIHPIPTMPTNNDAMKLSSSATSVPKPIQSVPAASPPSVTSSAASPNVSPVIAAIAPTGTAVASPSPFIANTTSTNVSPVIAATAPIRTAVASPSPFIATTTSTNVSPVIAATAPTRTAAASPPAFTANTTSQNVSPVITNAPRITAPAQPKAVVPIQKFEPNVEPDAAPVPIAKSEVSKSRRSLKENAPVNKSHRSLKEEIPVSKSHRSLKEEFSVNKSHMSLNDEIVASQHSLKPESEADEDELIKPGKSMQSLKSNLKKKSKNSLDELRKDQRKQRKEEKRKARLIKTEYTGLMRHETFTGARTTVTPRSRAVSMPVSEPGRFIVEIAGRTYEKIFDGDRFVFIELAKPISKSRQQSETRQDGTRSTVDEIRRRKESEGRYYEGHDARNHRERQPSDRRNYDDKYHGSYRGRESSDRNVYDDRYPDRNAAHAEPFDRKNNGDGVDRKPAHRERGTSNRNPTYTNQHPSRAYHDKHLSDRRPYDGRYPVDEKMTYHDRQLSDRRPYDDRHPNPNFNERKQFDHNPADIYRQEPINRDKYPQHCRQVSDHQRKSELPQSSYLDLRNDQESYAPSLNQCQKEQINEILKDGMPPEDLSYAGATVWDSDVENSRDSIVIPLSAPAISESVRQSLTEPADKPFKIVFNGQPESVETVQLLSNALSSEKMEKVKLQQENQELKQQIAILKKRVLRDLGSEKFIADKLSKVPTSVQANLNLKNQFEQRLSVERQKYSKLLESNRKLVLQLKDMEITLNKKAVANEQSTKSNEALYWRNKYKEQERDKSKVADSLHQITIQLEREQKINEKLRKKIEMMKMHYNLLPPKKMLEEEVEIKLKQDAELDFDVKQILPELEATTKKIIEDKQIPPDRLRVAKVQVEYDVWVNKKQGIIQ